MKIRTLPVLDDLPDKDLPVGWVLLPTGDLDEAGGLRREIATLPCQDLVDAKVRDETYRDRLDDPELPDRVGQFDERRLVENLPRLLRVGTDAVDVDEEGTRERAAAFPLRGR